MKKQAKNNTREYSSKIYLTSKKVTHVSRRNKATSTSIFRPSGWSLQCWKASPMLTWVLPLEPVSRSYF